MSDTAMRMRQPVGGDVDLQLLFKLCRDKQASDLHLVKDEPPILRINGDLVRSNYPPLDEELLEALIPGMMTDRQRRVFEDYHDIDFALTVPGVGRFRVNVHQERGALGAALRRLPLSVPSMEELGLPKAAEELLRKPNGSVLVTGPVGCGKSTTLAAMVDQINRERACHIITIEDPIEFLHTNKKSVIKQREVPDDTPSFGHGLKYALRQDPNVIVVGEMRDLETISTALTAAEDRAPGAGNTAYPGCRASHRTHHRCLSGRAASANSITTGQQLAGNYRPVLITRHLGTRHGAGLRIAYQHPGRPYDHSR